MTGVTLTYRLDDRAAQAAFSGLIRSGQNLEPLLDEIGAALVTSTQLRFERGAAPDGTSWKPSIRAAEQGGKTLIDRGSLRDSITHRAGPREVEVGTNVIYAGLQQFGGTVRAKAAPHLKFRIGGRFVSKKQVTVPARPFLGLSRGDEAAIGRRTTAALDRAIRGIAV